MKTYYPIILIAAVVALVSALTSLAHGFSLMQWMHGWMGGVLVIFSLFKLFDLNGFAADFAKYDLLAGRVAVYAKIYPVLELALGVAYFTFFVPAATYGATIVLFGFGLIGVIKALREGRDLQCACVGRILNLPLSRVAVIENSTMVAMSAIMLVSLVI